MNTQPEFAELLEDLPESSPKLPATKRGLNAANYTIGLAAALKTENLTHALFNLLTSIARAMASGTKATPARCSLELAVSHQSVYLHVCKNPDLFEVHPGHGRTHYTLTPEAVRLLVSVNRKAKRYARQH